MDKDEMKLHFPQKKGRISFIPLIKLPGPRILFLNETSITIKI